MYVHILIANFGFDRCNFELNMKEKKKRFEAIKKKSKEKSKIKKNEDTRQVKFAFHFGTRRY